MSGLGRGVRTLAAIRDRCRIESGTGCWLWSMATKGKACICPVVWVAVGARLGSKAEVTEVGQHLTATKASWLLSGNDIEPGQVVWRRVCANELCVNPAHLHASTRSEMHKAIAATGRNKGVASRSIINTRNGSWCLAPRDVVVKAEAMFAAGAMQKTVCAELGLSPMTAAKIKLRKHPNSSDYCAVVRGASVFAWRPAA